MEKPVASAAYSFVRFIGGGLAPYAADRMVLAVGIHFPFFIAAGAIVAGILILTTAHGLLSEAERVQAEQVTGAVAASAKPANGLMDGSASRELWRHARSNVLIVNPDDGGRRGGEAGTGSVRDKESSPPVSRAAARGGAGPGPA